jgi:rhodanese-related sulfurtransferase
MKTSHPTRLMMLLLPLLVLISCRTSSDMRGDTPVIFTLEETASLVGNPSVLFVDNRPPFKFAEGRIPGAVNLPYFQKGDATNVMDEANLRKAASGKKQIIFYCSGMMRAYHALLAAREWGVEGDLAWYKDGMESWKQSGKPTEP